MGQFKQYLQENEEALAQITSILDELTEDELDILGYVIYNEFFDDNDEDESDEEEEFSKEDILAMVKELGPDMYEEILDMMEEEVEDNDDIETEIEEGVSRIMRTKNMNKKKRKFMSNSKADLRRTKTKRKQKARKDKAKRKRYYRANKKKIAAYQKSRAAAIKKGKHKVKVRRKA